MAQHAFDDAMASVPAAARPAPGGGWKRLFWLAIAAAGVGFAGYVYFVPYHQMASALDSRSRELGVERKAGQELTVERDRLKASMGKGGTVAIEPVKSAGDAKDDSKRKEALETISAQLKSPLEELGAAVATEGDRVTISLADRAVDKNGIDVSSEGQAVLRILAGAVKKTESSVRIRARFGSAPAPKQLRGLFGTVGEVAAVRAARVMSFLQGAGVAPERLAVVGAGASEAEKDQPKEKPKAGKAKRAPAATMADRMDIEVEP